MTFATRVVRAGADSASADRPAARFSAFLPRPVAKTAAAGGAGRPGSEPGRIRGARPDAKPRSPAGKAQPARTSLGGWPAGTVRPQTFARALNGRML